MEVEIEKFECESEMLLSELKELEHAASEKEGLLRAATAEKNGLDEQLKQKSVLIDDLDKEREALKRSQLEARENRKVEMQSLESEARGVKESHSDLMRTVQLIEADSKKLRREIANLEIKMGKELEEIRTLESMRGGDDSEDSVLREKAEVSRKIAALNEKTKVSTSMSEKALAEVHLMEEEVRSNKQLKKELEARISTLRNQHADMIQLLKSKQEETESNTQTSADIESRRMEASAEIEKRENFLNHTVLRELKETSRKHAHVSAKLTGARRDEKEKGANLRDAERALEDRITKIKQATTQKEFLHHRIAADTDLIAKLGRDLGELEQAHFDMKQKDKSVQLEAICAENAELELQVEKLETEMDFLHQNRMLSQDGRLKPIQIQNDTLDELVKKLGINDFLELAQSEPEVYKTNLMLVEKISHLLELVHNSETLESQYLKDLDRSKEMYRQLGDKKSEIAKELYDVENFVDSALVQMGLNQLRGTSLERAKILNLSGLGFSDSDMQKMMSALEPGEKAKLESINFDNNKLIQFDLARLVTECVSLKVIDVRGNPLESLNELERYLRCKMEGITSVFRDAKVIIANSGQQVRLTVHHGKGN